MRNSSHVWGTKPLLLFVQVKQEFSYSHSSQNKASCLWGKSLGLWIVLTCSHFKSCFSFIAKNTLKLSQRHNRAGCLKLESSPVWIELLSNRLISACILHCHCCESFTMRSFYFPLFSSWVKFHFLCQMQLTLNVLTNYRHPLLCS